MLKKSFLMVGVCLLMSVGFSGETQGRIQDSPFQDSCKIVRAYKPVVGQPHPDFILPSIGEQKTSIQLSDYRGKKVLLLHFASW